MKTIDEILDQAQPVDEYYGQDPRGLTWGKLDSRTEGGLSDYIGSFWEDGPDPDDEVWDCDALVGVFEGLIAEARDQTDAEYLELEMLARDIQQAINKYQGPYFWPFVTTKIGA